MYICFKCQTVLVRYYHPTLEAEDIWVCPECKVIYQKDNRTEDDIEQLRRWI